MQPRYAFRRWSLLPKGSDPNGIRTRVTAVKGRCPRPLDDRVSERQISRRRPALQVAFLSNGRNSKSQEHQSRLVLIKIELCAPAPRLDGVSPYHRVLANVSLVGRRSA